MRKGKLQSPLVCLILAAFLCNCEDLPKDPEQSLERIRSGKVRIGVSENPPFASYKDDTPAGIEPQLLAPLFQQLKTQPEWQQLGESDLFEKLEKHELDLVIGGIRDDSPWKERLGLTLHYLEREEDGKKRRYVLAAPPGENRWIHELDKFLVTQREAASKLFRQEAQR